MATVLKSKRFNRLLDRSLLLGQLGLVPFCLTTAIADLCIRWEAMEGWGAGMWATWLGSCALSIGIWQGCFALTGAVYRRHRAAGVALIVALAFALNFVVVATLNYFLVLGDYPVSTTLLYVIEEPASTVGLVAPFLEQPGPLACVVGLPLLIMAWWVAAVRSRQRDEVEGEGRWSWRRWRRLGWAAPLVVAAGLILPNPGHYGFLSPDAHAVVQALNVSGQLLFAQRDRLHAGHRFIVPTQPPRPGRPNVLFVVHEAVAPRQMSLYGAPWETTPHHERLVAEAGQDVVVFDNAQTNSGFTLISVVSMMTGLSPERSSVDIHSAPLPWDWAQAAGYETFLYTPQSYSWGSFDEFLLTPSLHSHLTAESSGLPVVNDVGVDDGKIVDAAVSHIEAVGERRSDGQGQPFFGVVHFNGTHFPYLQHEPFKRQWDVDHPLDVEQLNSLLHIDHQVGRLWDALGAAGLQEDTVVVITSDHGSHLRGETQPHKRGRSENYYEVIGRIPLLVTIPPKARPDLRRGLSTLKANRSRRVSNLDILPTLLDVMGLDGQDVAPLRAELDGTSLLRPITDDRWIVYTNVTAFRGRERQGFSLTRGRQKYVFFTPDVGCDEELYDIVADPRELNDRWGTVDPEVKAAIYEQIRRRPWLEDIRAGRCGW